MATMAKKFREKKIEKIVFLNLWETLVTDCRANHSSFSIIPRHYLDILSIEKVLYKFEADFYWKCDSQSESSMTYIVVAVD